MRRNDRPLLRAEHLERKALVYVRQSSDFQVRNHVERQRMQYALADHARALGFSEVEVIDEDQGASGDGRLRPGFDGLLTAVCRGQAGLVLSLEASRLARNGRDWHTLLDYCAIMDCLVGDAQQLYDPGHADDRLFLGMKGNFIPRADRAHCADTQPRVPILTRTDSGSVRGCRHATTPAGSSFR